MWKYNNKGANKIIGGSNPLEYNQIIAEMKLP